MKRPDFPTLAILLLALLLRVVLLGVKPAHFDEGVNGWFVDQMTRSGFYHYDPTNFHGPMHFYVLFVAQSLFGRHEWALRLPLALVSTGCVGLMLAFRPFLGTAVSRLGALCMAVSPAFVFYGRYAIHESWFLFFILLTAWGLQWLCHRGTRPGLWAATIGVTGMLLTKETYIVHMVALASGYGVLRWWERYAPSAPFTTAVQQWTQRDLANTCAVCAVALVLFYTGFLMDWSSLPGFFAGLFAWTHTGMGGTTGHEKEPWYWLTLMTKYEWPGLLGLVASAALLLPGGPRPLRWLAFNGAAAFFAYSIIAYKTPWCLVTMLWPFYFVLGAAVVWLGARIDRWVVGSVAAVAIAVSATTSLGLNFKNYDDETEPYVYVQTRRDIDQLLGPLRALVARDRTFRHLPGYVVLGDVHPLPWLLAEFTRVHILNLTELPPDVTDAEFFLIAEEYQQDIERTIAGPWIREKITLRGNSGQSQLLYFRPDLFGDFFPGREADFNGPTPAPDPEARPAQVAPPPVL